LLLETLSEATRYTQFTDLGLNPVAWDLGFFQIRWYSLSYLAMIVLGFWFMGKLLKTPGAPMSRRHSEDLIFYITLGVIFGGRLGYVLFYQPSLLLNPVDIFKTWNGGMSLHGGTIGTVFAIWLMTRRNKLSFIRVCDYIACCVPFGTFLVRIANFVNGELWGKVTDVPWAIIPGAGQSPRHPSTLYEAVCEGLLMAAIVWPLFWRSDARYKPGMLVGTAALIYGVARFSIEFFRQPDEQLQWLADSSGLSMGQWLTIPFILIGLWLVITANSRRQRVEPVLGNNSVA
jgi:phosphatidylglycerol---prolipoprotein diacylglyceryl transferase